MISVDLMSLWNAVCSVHLCFSVRKRTIARLAGEFFLSQSAQSSLSIFAHSFEPTERLRHTEVTEASPPAPLRMERGVVCEVTPFGLLIEGDRLLNIWKTCRGISVITGGVSKCKYHLDNLTV